MNKKFLKKYAIKGSSLALTYGKLTKPPYSEQGLWFVEVPITRTATYTCIVPEPYTHPDIFETFRTQRSAWEQVACHIYDDIDGWDYYNECLWSESPVHEYNVFDGTTLRYGYSRTQSEKHPQYELWYMSMFEGHAVIIEKECLTPCFIHKIHSGAFLSPHREPLMWWRWVGVAWSHVIADSIGAGDQCRGVNMSLWKLDPPNLCHKNPPDIHALFKKDEELEKHKKRSWWQF